MKRHVDTKNKEEQEVQSMATSSIIEDIKINNPKVMEEYVAALEAAEKAPIVPVQELAARRITDPAELKKIMLRGIEKWGKK